MYAEERSQFEICMDAIRDKDLVAVTSCLEQGYPVNFNYVSFFFSVSSVLSLWAFTVHFLKSMVILHSCALAREDTWL